MTGKLRLQLGQRPLFSELRDHFGQPGKLTCQYPTRSSTKMFGIAATMVIIVVAVSFNYLEFEPETLEPAEMAQQGYAYLHSTTGECIRIWAGDR
jgi:hypothetical protein